MANLIDWTKPEAYSQDNIGVALGQVSDCPLSGPAKAQTSTPTDRTSAERDL